MNEPDLTEAVKTDLPSPKPKRRKRLALRFAVLVAAASALGAACLIWPRTPFGFLQGLQCVEDPAKLSIGDRITLKKFAYCGKADFWVLINKARAELAGHGWTEGRPGPSGIGPRHMNLRIEYHKDSGRSLETENNVVFYQDVRVDISINGLRFRHAPGWVVIQGLIEVPPPSIWEQNWDRLRGAHYLQG
jgi:hypothetical protein